MYKYGLFFLAFFALGHLNAVTQILLLHSYHQGYEWTDSINEHLLKSFAEVYPADIHITYMDAKRNEAYTHSAQFYQNLLRELQGINFSLIILCDDNALKFAVENKFYPQVPMVFLGVNYIDNLNLASHPNITGVVEPLAFKKTLLLAKSINSEAENCFIIADSTLAGKNSLQNFQDDISELGEIFKFFYLTNLGPEEVTLKLQNIPQNSVVFLASYLLDKNGNYLPPSYTIPRLTAQHRIPLYSCWDYTLKYGCLGGYVTSAEKQVKAAMRLATAILTGTNPSSLPIDSLEEEIPIFNYNSLKRYKIAEEKLPQQKIILYKPKAFYEVNKNFIVLAFLLFLLLLIIIFTSYLSYRRQKKLIYAIRLSEHDLERQNSFLQALIDGIPLPFFFKDTNGCYRLCNRALIEFLGIEKRELIGKTVADIYHPDLAEKFAKMDKELWENNGTQTYDYFFQKKDNSYAEMLSCRATVNDQDGNLLGMEGISLDISELRKNERALKESEEKHRIISQLITDFIYSVKIVGGKAVFEWLTGAFTAITGYIPEKSITDGIFDFIHPEDKELQQNAHRQVEEGKSNICQYRIIAADGEIKWLREYIKPVWVNGELKSYYCAIQEITREREASEKLHRSEELFRSMFQNHAAAMLLIEPQQLKITDVNKAAEIFYGYGRDEFLQKTLWELTVAQTPAFKFPLSGSYRLTHRQKKEREVEVEMLINLIPLAKEQQLYFAIICDMTERLKAEQTIMQAMQIAEQANRSKSDFLANVSHEIRTPMNGIIGLTELVRQAALDPQDKHYLELINLSAKHLLFLINDILDFSKLEQQRLEIQPSWFNLQEFMQHTVDFYAPQMREKKLDFYYEFAPQTPLTVYTDPNRLRQIIFNLLNNAVKFTQQGFIKLKVEASAPEELLFTVEDSGLGIEENLLQKVFESFYQVENFLSKQYEGTGLGLAISKNLCQLLGGKIWATSKIDVGSKFCFTIANKAINRQVSLLPAVLIAEDNLIANKILLAWCKKQGYRSVCVASFAEVFSELKKNAYDFLLLALTNAEVDFFQRLEQSDNQPSIIGLANDAMELQGFKQYLKTWFIRPLDYLKLKNFLQTERGK